MMRKWTFLKLSFSNGFSSYPPKTARRFVFPFFAEVGAKRERMVTKHKGPWEGERLEVSPVFSLSPSFARKFSTRESRLGQQAAPEGESTRTLAEAFIYKHISVANLKNTCQLYNLDFMLFQGMSQKWLSTERALDLRTRRSSSTRFNLKLSIPKQPGPEAKKRPKRHQSSALSFKNQFLQLHHGKLDTH